MAAKSLLQQIREKESDLDREMDQAIKDSRKIVEDAQQEAGIILREAELAGSSAAEEYLRGAREQTDREISTLRENGRERQAAIRKSTESRMPGAVEYLVKAVAFR